MSVDLKLPVLPDGYRWERYAQPFNKVSLVVFDTNGEVVAETGKHSVRMLNLFVASRVARQVMNLAAARERANSDWVY